MTKRFIEQNGLTESVKYFNRVDVYQNFKSISMSNINTLFFWMSSLRVVMHFKSHQPSR